MSVGENFNPIGEKKESIKERIKESIKESIKENNRKERKNISPPKGGCGQPDFSKKNTPPPCPYKQNPVLV